MPPKRPGLRRVAGVVEVDRVDLALLQRLREVDEHGAELALVLQRRVAPSRILSTFSVVDQVELDARVVLQHPEADRVLAADELLLRIDADVEVVGEQVVVGAVRAVARRAACRPSSARAGGGRRDRLRLRLHLVFLRRLDAHQPLHEVVPPPPHHVGRRAAVAVVLVRQHQQVEVLVRLDQRVDDEHRLVRRHVGVHRAVRQQQVALQVLREVLVRLGRRSCRCRPAFFVTAGPGSARPSRPRSARWSWLPDSAMPDLEEVGEAEHRRRRGEPAARVAPDAGAVDVDPRVLAAPAPSCRRSGRASCCRGPSRRSRRPGTTSTGPACPCRRSSRR